MKLNWNTAAGLALAVLVSGGHARAASASDDVLGSVDPFIGVDKNGNVPPGACLPFSLVRLSPDTTHPQTTSGYISRLPLVGFSHTHTSGTGGGGRYGNILVTPQVGPISLDTVSSKSEEVASPGYYAVRLTKPDVRAELTLTERCGVHRYTFPASDSARILINASATRSRAVPTSGSSVCVSANARFVSDRRIEGSVTAVGGFGHNTPGTVWFAVELDKAPERQGVWRDGKIEPRSRETTGTNCGIYAEYKTKAGEQIGMRVGVSVSSIENARKHLAQSDGMTFDQVHERASGIWRKFLNRIQIEGGTPEQRTCFYTALYHSVLMPTDVTDDNPDKAFKKPHFWDFYCIWDTWHTANPLYILLIPEKEAQIVNCLTEIFQHRGWLPDAWIMNDFAMVQGGTNADVVLADAIVKTLPGINRETAYAAIRKDATEPGSDPLKFGRYKEYFEMGYLPCEDIKARNPLRCPVSRTMEYAFNDFCVAQAAAALGKTDDALRFTSQSLNVYNLFDPTTKYFWAKDRNGKFFPGFTPEFYTPSWLGPFYEGTPRQYATFVPHDVQGLINRHGGSTQFEAFLDELFDTKHYSPSNEPDLLAPWLYTYVNRPDKNVDRVRHILSDDYTTTRAGLPGNDDAGTLSAWYVFGAMGFYPNPAQDLYLMASPIFSKVKLQLGGGKKLVITAANLSDKNIYIQSATLNGKPLRHGWFRHSDIANGGQLVLKMGPKPSKWGTHGPVPPSVSKP